MKCALNSNRFKPKFKFIPGISPYTIKQTTSNKKRIFCWFFTDTDVDIETGIDIECIPEWPYFYLGEYTQYSDILSIDIFDKGHPKSASRIGKLYQAEVPLNVGSNDISAQNSDDESYIKKSKKKKIDKCK